MSSARSIVEDVGWEQSRRSTRERKQAQYFGYPEPSDGGKPSLIVTLSLSAPTLPQTPLLPSIQSDGAPATKVEKNIEAQAGSSSGTPQKRSAALIEDGNDSNLFQSSSSREQAPKRQRLQPSTPKPRAIPKAKNAVNLMHDDRPEPRGQPEVWAEIRQSLCEALPYYQAYQSGVYSWGGEHGKGGYVYGFLLDNDNDERGYMDEKVVITRVGGGVKVNLQTGHMEQMDDQSSDSSRATIFSNNQKEMVPIILIVGAKNAHCPTRVPHRYNVLGTFHVTDSWSERAKGKTVCRVRLDMLDLKLPSWWGAKGSPLPAQTPDYITKALVQTCSACGIVSKQRYAPGWMCLSETCASFSKIDGQAASEPLAFNPAFIAERTKWPAHVKAPFPLKPAPPTDHLNNPEMETSLSAWKGMVCPFCGGCNSRSEWDEWKCRTEGCTFEIPINHSVRTASALAPEHAFEAEGHAMSFDKWEAPVVCAKIDFLGYWRKATYELSTGNYITHYFANQEINRQSGGADEILEALQGTKMGLKRHPLESSPIEGDILTRHFGINYGLPYKFVAPPDTKAFSQAPPAIMNALNRLTWAGQDAVADGSYRPFNELLCLGYMESQRIGMHDDGEKDLGPDIASLSLGGAATMNFRMKSKHWIARGLTAQNYDPELLVQPGSQAWEMRVAANQLHQAGRVEEFEAATAQLFRFLAKDSEKRKRNGPIALSLELRHGDMVVMHGEQIQEIYEHGVQPKGKLRFGLTGRYIKPENIPAEEHWKGDFTIAPEKVYDGDLALFKSNFPEEEEE